MGWQHDVVDFELGGFSLIQSARLHDLPTNHLSSSQVDSVGASDPLPAPQGSNSRSQGEGNEAARFQLVSRSQRRVSPQSLSLLPACACRRERTHVHVQNVMRAPCCAAGLGIFCFYLADLVLGRLPAPIYGHTASRRSIALTVFVTDFVASQDMRFTWCGVALFLSLWTNFSEYDGDPGLYAHVVFQLNVPDAAKSVENARGAIAMHRFVIML